MTPKRDSRMVMVIGGVIVLSLLIFMFVGCASSNPAGPPSWWTEGNNIKTAEQAAVYYQKASIYYEALAKGFVEYRRSGQCDDACWQTFATYRDRVGVTAVQAGTAVEVWRAGGGNMEFATLYPIFVKAIQDLQNLRGN